MIVNDQEPTLRHQMLPLPKVLNGRVLERVEFEGLAWVGKINNSRYACMVEAHTPKTDLYMSREKRKKGRWELS